MKPLIFTKKVENDGCEQTVIYKKLLQEYLTHSSYLPYDYLVVFNQYDDGDD